MFQKQLIYHSCDCFLITIYYSIGGIIMSYFMEKVFVDINYHYRYNNLFLLIIDIVLSLFTINLFALFLRLLIDYIPLPFSKFVKKKTTFLIDGGIVLAISILLFQNKFDEKCKLLSKELHII